MGARLRVGNPTGTRGSWHGRDGDADSFPGRSFEGWVGFISPIAEFTPKTVQTEDLRTSLVYEVRIYVKDPDNELRLGMPATVRLDPPQGRDVAGCPADGRLIVTAAAAQIAVAAAGLGKRFRRKTGEVVVALDDVSFAARSGTLTAIVGPDGAGKTTLLRLMCGLMKAEAGTLSVIGRDVAATPQEIQDRIGYMPQKFGLYEDLTVQENLDLYADLHGVNAGKRSVASIRA